MGTMSRTRMGRSDFAMDATTVEEMLKRADVVDASELAVHVHGDPKNPAHRAAALAPVRKALVNYDGTAPLLGFVTEVARRALVSQES